MSENTEQQAQAMRRERDKKYPNIYAVADTDLRWVGDMAEIVFHRWLGENAPGAGVWIRKRAAGKPDFKIYGHTVGLKTVKRKVPFRPDYTCQITAQHAEEKAHHFFFASYEFLARRLWLIGGVTKEHFLDKAKYYEAGDKVHDNYTIRPGHEIYNIEARYLTPPAEWLRSVAENPRNDEEA